MKNAQFVSGSNFVLAFVLVMAIAGWVGCGSATTEDVAPSSSKTTLGAPAEIDLEQPTVRITTSLGAIDVELDAKRAPGTVRNFLNYMNEGFYDNTLIHYVAPDAMIVGGGYAPDGQLKPTHPPIRNEAHNDWKNTRGTIAMARNASAGIDSATSQFFINLADAPSLDHRGDSSEDYGYCVFGEVTDGLDVAEKISRVGTRDLGGDLAQSPDPPVVIESIDFVR